MLQKNRTPPNILSNSQKTLDTSKHTFKPTENPGHLQTSLQTDRKPWTPPNIPSNPQKTPDTSPNPCAENPGHLCKPSPQKTPDTSSNL
jgi:hypothetical protein